MDTRTELLREIDTFQSRVKLSDTAIGAIALNDTKFVARLRGGRRCWPETAQKVRSLMAAAYTAITTADGTVIIRDIETGQSASGSSLASAYSELRHAIEIKGSPRYRINKQNAAVKEIAKEAVGPETIKEVVKNA